MQNLPSKEGPSAHEDVDAESCEPLQSIFEEIRGDGPFGVEFSDHLQVPIEVRDTVRGLQKNEQIERDLHLSCARLVYAKKHNHLAAAQRAQTAINVIIAYHEGEGRRDAARIARKGIKNLEAGKLFNASPGKTPDLSRIIQVVVAIYELKLSLGGNYPGRNAIFKKVNEFADGETCPPIPRANLGKVIRKLGLDDHIGGKRSTQK